MKFLVDAQLPRKVCSWLSDFGHEAKHTLDLPLKNKTADHQIIEIAVEEDHFFVGQDNDVVQRLGTQCYHNFPQASLKLSIPITGAVLILPIFILGN